MIPKNHILYLTELTDFLIMEKLLSWISIMGLESTDCSNFLQIVHRSTKMKPKVKFTCFAVVLISVQSVAISLQLSSPLR